MYEENTFLESGHVRGVVRGFAGNGQRNRPWADVANVMITLMVITDGRGHCLDQAIASFNALVEGPVYNRLIVNDCVDARYGAWLEDRYGDEFNIINHETKRGFCGAIQSGWANLPDETGWIFHLEDDFVFNRKLDLWSMIEVLDAHPDLVQLALRRQPWNEDEKRAGGIVEQWPDEYVEKSWNDHHWLEHRLFFTTNPSLYRVELTDLGWPDAPRCEGAFTDKILEDPVAQFGFWGSRNSGEWVTHIGDERVGVGY